VTGNRINARGVYAVTLLLAAVWTAMAALAPAIETLLIRSGSARMAVYVAVLLDAIYGHVCHQIAGRSIYLAAGPMAVCARCFGIYSGYLAGLAVYPFVRALDRIETPRRLWLALGLAPTFIDFVAGLFGVIHNNLASRAVTGLAAGVTLAFYTLPGIIALFGDLVTWVKDGRSARVQISVAHHIR
jgi:uncharacterized membrane protein